MKRWLISGAFVVAALAGIALAIAAVNGGDSGTGSAAPAMNTGSTVSTRQIDGAGSVLVDSTGRALYANDQEKGGMVLCDGACLSFWTPLTVDGGAPKGDSLRGNLGVVTRPDGAKQVTFNGKLLYTFYLDKPGEVGGDGFDDAFGGRQFTWHVVQGNGSTSSSDSGQAGGSDIPGY